MAKHSQFDLVGLRTADVLSVRGLVFIHFTAADAIAAAAAQCWHKIYFTSNYVLHLWQQLLNWWRRERQKKKNVRKLSVFFLSTSPCACHCDFWFRHRRIGIVVNWRRPKKAIRFFLLWIPRIWHVDRMVQLLSPHVSNHKINRSGGSMCSNLDSNVLYAPTVLVFQWRNHISISKAVAVRFIVPFINWAPVRARPTVFFLEVFFIDFHFDSIRAYNGNRFQKNCPF